MHPLLTYAVASAREQDARRHSRNHAHASELPARRSRIAARLRFSRYFGHASAAHEQPFRRAGRRARGT